MQLILDRKKTVIHLQSLNMSQLQRISGIIYKWSAVMDRQLLRLYCLAYSLNKTLRAQKETMIRRRCHLRPCHGSGRYLLAAHCGRLGSHQGQSMRDLWCTHWQWDRFVSDFFGFYLSASLYRRSRYSHHVGMNNGTFRRIFL
jgi:hypothetical protein